MDVHPSGDHLIVGGYDRKLCWFDLELSEKPYKVLRYDLSRFKKLTTSLTSFIQVPLTRHPFAPFPSIVSTIRFFVRRWINSNLPLKSVQRSHDRSTHRTLEDFAGA